jgi:transposase
VRAAYRERGQRIVEGIALSNVSRDHGRIGGARMGAGERAATQARVVEKGVLLDTKAFRSGRDFSAWIGLVPKQNSSGGKEKLGSISKQGDRYLRSLFTTGALAVIRYAKIHGTKHRPWHCWRVGPPRSQPSR